MDVSSLKKRSIEKLIESIGCSSFLEKCTCRKRRGFLRVARALRDGIRCCRLNSDTSTLSTCVHRALSVQN